MLVILELLSFVDGRLERSFRIEPGSPLLEGFEGEVEGPFLLEVSLTQPTADTYVLDARLTGAVSRPCCRCLEPVQVDLDDRFRLVYQRAENEMDSGDDDVILLDPEATRIDLTGPVRDRLFLDTEAYPLCREDCAGICAECGQNLNEGSCSCVPESPDSRWRGLEAVRGRLEETG